MVIKVGQIWRGDTKEDTIVITHIHKHRKRKQDLWEIDYVWRDGETVASDDLYFVTCGRRLISEYNTWQEAVNSKEFGGEK